MSENKIPARSFFDWCVRRSGGNQGGIAVAAQAAFHQNGISELAVSADLDLEKAVLGEKKSGIALVEKVVKHTVGILAAVSQVCAEHNANVIEVTQSVMEELFVMVMLVNIDHLSGGINGLSQSMNELGEEKNLKIHVMHEDIFHSMHRI